MPEMVTTQLLGFSPHSEAKFETETCYRTFLFASSMTFSADFLSLDRLRAREIHFDNHMLGERRRPGELLLHRSQNPHISGWISNPLPLASPPGHLPALQTFILHRLFAIFKKQLPKTQFFLSLDCKVFPPSIHCPSGQH